MRPLFSVVLVPSTPMNEDKLSTSGSCRMTCGQLLLALGHSGERDALRRIGDAQDHAGVLHREKPLGTIDVELDRSATSVPTVTSSVRV